MIVPIVLEGFYIMKRKGKRGKIKRCPTSEKKGAKLLNRI